MIEISASKYQFMFDVNNSPEYQCPICHTQMALNEKTLTCETGHSFDYAKEGYVHLLPVQLKKSLNPGDDKQMVIARREFLSKGYYDFLRLELLKQIQESSPSHLLDLGCGEGFYTNFIKSNFETSKVYGVDISKDAVKYASKRNKAVHYCVATNAHTPFSNQQFDLIFNVFAPLIGKECQRILKAGGNILSVSPAAKHLIELKQAIYDSPELHSVATAPEGFIVNQTHNIQQQITITAQDDLENLLKMTPFGWKITKEKQQLLFSKLPFTITLDFTLNEYKLENEL